VVKIKEHIREIADAYADELQQQINNRLREMQSDDKSHYLIYRILSISTTEGDTIDIYQNKGRFLYRYAGAFLERAARLCFEEAFPNAQPSRIPNTIGSRPKTFEIDCLVGHEAYEIKWRDATTDGDHITKEHTRLKAVIQAGYIPVRLMFYDPNRGQAIRIQAVLEHLYRGLGGLHFHGEMAWEHIAQKTGIDLKHILEEIAEERES
jgi:hypothetical protein